MYRGFSNPGVLPPPRGPAPSGQPPPARGAHPYYGGPLPFPGPPPNMPPLGHLNPRQCGPVLSPSPGPDSNYLHNRHNVCPAFRPQLVSTEPSRIPPAGPSLAQDFESYNLYESWARPRKPRKGKTQPHCSSFSIGHNTGMTLGSQQIPQWNHTGTLEHQKDNSERAGEEFLRCLATNQPFPDYLKGNMSYNLADALKSANALKAAVSTDPEFQKHIIKSKSRSRSRGRSCRAKSRARSKSRVRSRSPSRSKGRSTSRSRAKSRARSKSRAPSRSRGKSRARSKSRGRSRSPTKKQERSKSRARAKSRARSRSRSHSHEKSSAKEHRNGNHQSHNSYSSGCNLSNSNASTGNESLLQGLQRVINSNDLEMGLPALKDAIRTIKATNQKKDIKVESVSSQESECLNNTSTNARPMESDRMLQSECLNNTFMNARPMESDSMLLPHERVGIDFSWLQASNQEVSAAVQKEDDLDDEEFLYGREDGGKRPYTNTPAPYASVSQSRQRSAPQHNQVECSPAPSQTYALSNPMFNSLGDLIDVKQLGGSASPSQNTTKTDHRLKQELPPCGPDDKEYEKIQGLLKNFGLNMGIADIGTMMTKIQQDQKKEALTPPPQPTGCGTVPAGLGFATAAMGHTGVRHALESLQCLIKATKEKRAKGDPHGRSDSPKTIVKQRDPAEEERLKREKQARMKKIETLLKDLDVLLKENGTDFMIPVIGFYCQKCEEFIGDLSTAESHASTHSHKDSSVVHTDKKMVTEKKMVEDKGHSLPHSSSGSRHPHHSDRKDQRDSSYHRDTVDHRDRPDYHGNQRDERDHRGSDLKHKQDSDPRGHRHEREKIAVREGMMKERLLITVSRGQSPPRSGIKAEIDKAQVYGKHSRTKQEDMDSKGKSSTKESNTQESEDSSDSSEDEKGKSSGKSPKKKKKKKEKKKDKKKKKDSHKKN